MPEVTAFYLQNTVGIFKKVISHFIPFSRGLREHSTVQIQQECNKIMVAVIFFFFRLRAMNLFEPMSKGKEEYI